MNAFITSIRLDALSRRQFAFIAIALVITQGVLWIGAPLLFEGSIRQDVAEGVVDGLEWRLSYPIHPPFSSWLSALASSLGPLRHAAVDAIGFTLASGAFAIVAALLVAGYVAEREIAPRVAQRPLYADMDGPAHAALAQRYWADRESGPIPYIVSLDEQRGLQAGGSIVFDSPYRIRMLQDDDLANAPWIDLADLRTRGALVVSPRSLAAGTRVEGVEVQQIEKFERPMRRGVSSEPIFFGLLPPNS